MEQVEYSRQNRVEQVDQSTWSTQSRAQVEWSRVEQTSGAEYSRVGRLNGVGNKVEQVEQSRAKQVDCRRVSPVKPQ